MSTKEYLAFIPVCDCTECHFYTENKLNDGILSLFDGRYLISCVEQDKFYVEDRFKGDDVRLRLWDSCPYRACNNGG